VLVYPGGGLTWVPDHVTRLFLGHNCRITANWKTGEAITRAGGANSHVPAGQQAAACTGKDLPRMETAAPAPPPDVRGGQARAAQLCRRQIGRLAESAGQPWMDLSVTPVGRWAILAVVKVFRRRGEAASGHRGDG